MCEVGCGRSGRCQFEAQFFPFRFFFSTLSQVMLFSRSLLSVVSSSSFITNSLRPSSHHFAGLPISLSALVAQVSHFVWQVSRPLFTSIFVVS